MSKFLALVTFAFVAALGAHDSSPAGAILELMRAIVLSVAAREIDRPAVTQR